MSDEFPGSFTGPYTDDDIQNTGDQLRDQFPPITLVAHPRDIETFKKHFPYAEVIPSKPVSEQDIRDLIETSLIINDPPEPGWRPNPEDLA